MLCRVGSWLQPAWYPVVWVILVPWLLVLDRSAGIRESAASGVAMAVAFSLAVFSWFPFAMADYAGAPVWATAVIGLVAAPVFQPAFVVFAIARAGARRRGHGVAAVAVVAASAFVATEWAVPKLFGDTLGIGLYPSPLLRQGAALAGLGGLTLVVVLVNEAVLAMLAAVRTGAHRAAAGALVVAAALVGGLAAYGQSRLTALASGGGEAPVTVGIVQADVTHYDRLAAEIGTYLAVQRILDAHFALSDELFARAPLDVLVWPETVYPTTFGTPKSADGEAFDHAIAALVVRHHRPLVFGSYDAEGGREYNAAVFLAPSAGTEVTFDTYRKATLFPFTERVPGWLDGPWLRQALPWVGSWTPGTGAATMVLALGDGRKLRVAPLICYDAVDPRNAARAVREGATVLVTLSNDSWLAEGAGAWLHFVVSAFRSIETGRPQVRATTTGISAVITATGAAVESAGVHVRAGLVGVVAPRSEAPPLATRWGDWLGPLAAVTTAAGLLAGGKAQQGGGVSSRRARAKKRLT